MKLRHEPHYICGYLLLYFWKKLSRVVNRQYVIWEVGHRVMELNPKREAAGTWPVLVFLLSLDSPWPFPR